MMLFVLAALYAACAVLLSAVWLQDRRRESGRGAGRTAADPRATQEFVFRTQA